MLPLMNPVMLSSEVVRDLPDTRPWGVDGPPVVYDGFELEPGGGAEMRPACLACGVPLPIDLTDVLSAPRIPDEPAFEGLGGAFGLSVKRWNDLGVVIDGLGLSAYLLTRVCAACGSGHAVCLGYGEFQPARYLVTFNGLALVAP